MRATRASYSTEAIIRRPVHEAFAYLSDLRNELEWNPAAQRIDKVTPGPIDVGTRYQAQWRNAPRTEVLVSDYRPARRWQTVSRSWGLDVVFTGELEAVGDGTRYVARLDVRAAGLARLLLPFALRAMQRQDRAHMHRLATLLGGEAEETRRRAAAPRQPAWSGIATRPLARVIPPSLERHALVAIRAIHTILFFSIAAAVVLALWDGLRGRPSRRTAVAGVIVAAESAIYVSNNQVCPLTPLAEEFGAARGSVVDLYLPDAVARRIPIVAGSSAVLAAVLNGRAVVAGRRARHRPATTE